MKSKNWIFSFMTSTWKITDMAMLTQWKHDSSFKVIIDLKVSRKKGENEKITDMNLKSQLGKSPNINTYQNFYIKRFI